MKKGFTLIELLVVVAIIALLAAIIFPVFARAREQARKASCMSNQKQLYMALVLYADDNEGWFPQVWDQRPNTLQGEWTDTYITNKSMIDCPSGDNPLYKGPGLCYAEYRVLAAVTDRLSNTTSNYFYGWLMSYASSPTNGYGAPCPNIEFPGTYQKGWAAGQNSYYIQPAAEQPAILDGWGPTGLWSFRSALGSVRNSHPEGENVVYVDGHAAWIPAARLGSGVGKFYYCRGGSHVCYW